MNRCAILTSLLLACSSSSTVSPDAETERPRDAERPASDATTEPPVDAELPVSDAALDASTRPTEPCENERDTRVVTCGNCGSAREVCEAGVWRMEGACLAQGECTAGALERTNMGRCVPHERLCDGTCRWLPWEAVGEPVAGACEVGVEVREQADCAVGSSRVSRCDPTTCAFTAIGECTSDCPGERRTAPWQSEEICIPAGQVVRGSNMADLASPPSTVTISTPFFIDRFPISVGRYKSCVDAGVCPQPRVETATWWPSPTAGQLDHAMIGLNRQAVQTFCSWDGGRRLPTDAEWELAAKGPAPRDPMYPWGDTPSLCELASNARCLFEPEASTLVLGRYAIDDLPEAASYYGVELMLYGVFEHMQDAWDDGFYAETARSTDPLNEGMFPWSQRGFAPERTNLNAAGNVAVSSRYVGILQPPPFGTGTPIPIISHHSGGRCARTP